MAQELEKVAHSNLAPFKEGFDVRRARGKGRPPVLDSQEKIDLFAQAVSDGATNKDLGEIFCCGETTVKQCRKDPRVKAAAMKLMEERVLRITRKTDSIIEGRLQAAEELDTTTLLKIRKEFLGGAFRLATTGDSKDVTTINEAMDQLEANPEFAAELQELLATKQN